MDVAGLYLDPSDTAVVPCMDNKSQIQPLGRTEPSLPMARGRGATTTLFDALDVATGKVIGRCLPRHRHEELPTLPSCAPATVSPHRAAGPPILGNERPREHVDVDERLARHERFHLRLTPTWWLKLVERWFRDLEEWALRRGVRVRPRPEHRRRGLP